MAKEAVIVPLSCNPGIQRDGTKLDSKSYIDGQWVRFQRGRPKKMNGYREINRNVNGPVRGMNTWSRQDLTQISLFSPWGVEAVQIDRYGVGQAIYDRTPSGFLVDGDAVWQMDTMYDAAAGSTKTLLFAHPGSNLLNIDNSTARDVYYGDASGTDPLVAIGSVAQVSGGIVCLPPYLVIYGSDGRVSWSNENEPRNFTTGSANTARITGSKIVKALPIRGQGVSPSALIWAQDSVHRMSWVGGQGIFKFDPISNASTILSSSSVVEYDGVYYWVGLDRFMMYNGHVAELPNTQNCNWFFDGINYEHRQKVFAAKVPRFGEIWWFFPKDDATECSHAVIYNVRENYWYDVELGRAAGIYSNVFRFPLWADSTPQEITERISLTSSSGFSIGDAVTGSSSGSGGLIRKIVDNNIFVIVSIGSSFQDGETISNGISASTAAIGNSNSVSLYQLWQQEFGKDKVEGDEETGITSFFETSSFGYSLGGDASGVSQNRWTRIVRVEPDFNIAGTMQMEITGSETADSEPSVSASYTFDKDTEVIDIREQRRELRLRFTSSNQNSDYEMGKILLHIDTGDGRN